jgi:hypothetical protein
MDKKSLVASVQDYKSLDQLLIENGGDLEGDQTEAIVMGWFAEINANIEDAADRYKYKMDSLAEAVTRSKDRIDLYKRAIMSLEFLSQSLESRLKQSMMELNRTELNGRDARFTLRQNPPSVDIVDPNKITAEYTREKITIEVDKMKIKEDLLSGKEVPGALLKRTIALRHGKTLKEIK